MNLYPPASVCTSRQKAAIELAVNWQMIMEHDGEEGRQSIMGPYQEVRRRPLPSRLRRAGYARALCAGDVRHQDGRRSLADRGTEADHPAKLAATERQRRRGAGRTTPHAHRVRRR